MQTIRNFLKNDRFAAHNGIELLEISQGRAKAKLDILDYHLNGANIVHGGAIFALADLVFAAASNSHGTIAVAINANISFLKASAGGTLYAEAREISKNPKLGTYTIDVTDENGDVIAIFQGMVYRKKDKIEDIIK